jgi:serine/threonine protein kinase
MKLQVIAGADSGRFYMLFDGVPTLLGRSRHADTRVNDLQVSRVHCQLEQEGLHVWITDLDSGGGTFVNGQRVAEHKARAGDVLRIGETELRLDPVSADEQASMAPEVGAPRKSADLNSARLQELAGTSLCHYHVGDLLARGQSGLVFRARDFKEDREVALKVLWPEHTRNRDEMRRFVRSIKTMLPIRHPNLVSLYGAGKTGAYCWIAMELVDGESLTKVIQRMGGASTIGWKHALRICYNVGLGLEFAHRSGIIHRNITPQNILVGKTPQQTRLGDLMLAKAMEGALAEQITRPGEILGDIRYMSPERTSGQANVDARSDIYSLGATVYALLTGRPPFKGASLGDTIMKIRKEEAARPRKKDPSITEPFEAIVLKMLAKRPDDRFASVTSLLTELQDVARSRAVPM